MWGDRSAFTGKDQADTQRLGRKQARMVPRAALFLEQSHSCATTFFLISSDFDEELLQQKVAGLYMWRTKNWAERGLFMQGISTYLEVNRREKRCQRRFGEGPRRVLAWPNVDTVFQPMGVWRQEAAKFDLSYHNDGGKKTQVDAGSLKAKSQKDEGRLGLFPACPWKVENHHPHARAQALQQSTGSKGPAGFWSAPRIQLR